MNSRLPPTNQLELFDLPKTEKKFKHVFGGLRVPIWTENKARMIEIYLRLFVYITKHGAYIDGFAGPQQPKLPKTWTAKLILGSQPQRLRQFFLCELKERKLKQLRSLLKVASNKANGKRKIELYEGDFNLNVDEVLSAGGIKEKTATFCLLDQHTFQCKWTTVEKLARAKSGMKIEIFYFVPTGWLKRAFAATQKKSIIRDWWGREDWVQLKKISSHACAESFCERFREELNYKHAYACLQGCDGSN